MAGQLVLTVSIFCAVAILQITGSEDFTADASNTTSTSSNNLTAETTTVSVTTGPINTTTEPHIVTTLPQNVTTESHNVTTEPHNVTTEPHNITTGPQNVTTEPHNITTGPQNVTTEPHNVTTPVPTHRPTEPTTPAAKFNVGIFFGGIAVGVVVAFLVGVVAYCVRKKMRNEPLRYKTISE